MSSQPRKILVAPAWPYAAGYRHLPHAAAYVPFAMFALSPRDDVLR
jgi:methionyl-tRNA synthetase